MPHLDPSPLASRTTESFPSKVTRPVPGQLAWHFTSDIWVPKVDLGLNLGSPGSIQPPPNQAATGLSASPSPEWMEWWGRARSITLAEGCCAPRSASLLLMLF